MREIIQIHSHHENQLGFGEEKGESDMFSLSSLSLCPLLCIFPPAVVKAGPCH